MSEIQAKIFVTPVEAFHIVGRESFGPNWDDSCTHDEDSELRRVALKNLNLALQSGQVHALWHDFDYERPLTPIQAAGEFFKIDLEQDCINLSFFAGQPIQASIHADDLRAFIRSSLDGTTTTTARTLSACRQWIVRRIKNGEQVEPKAFLKAEAEREFHGISGRAFDRARKNAIEETGSGDLKKGGRPKNNSNKSKT